MRYSRLKTFAAQTSTKSRVVSGNQPKYERHSWKGNPVVSNVVRSRRRWGIDTGDSRGDREELEQQVLMGYQGFLEFAHHRVSRVKDVAHVVFDALPEEDVGGEFVQAEAVLKPA